MSGGYDYEERTSVSYVKFGAKYTLSYVFYAYDDPEDRVAGSGIKSLSLMIEKGKHEIGEIDVDSLGKRNLKDLYAEAESDAEKFEED